MQQISKNGQPARLFSLVRLLRRLEYHSESEFSVEWEYGDYPQKKFAKPFQNLHAHLIGKIIMAYYP